MSNQTSAVNVNGGLRHGRKKRNDECRTIKGEHYIAWLTYPTLAVISRYRKAGIRCAKRGIDLYIHHMDEDEAKTLDITLRSENLMQ